MRQILTLMTVALFIFFSTSAWAGSYQYISAAETKEKLVQQTPMQIVDIQVEKEFNQHHLPGALATYAYPVKSDIDRSKLDTALPQLKKSTTQVVIVCPGGGGGAKRAYDYLLKKGIAAERLFILEKGQKGWPYPEQLAKL